MFHKTAFYDACSIKRHYMTRTVPNNAIIARIRQWHLCVYRRIITFWDVTRNWIPNKSTGSDICSKYIGEGEGDGLGWQQCEAREKAVACSGVSMSKGGAEDAEMERAIALSQKKAQLIRMVRCGGGPVSMMRFALCRQRAVRAWGSSVVHPPYGMAPIGI